MRDIDAIEMLRFQVTSLEGQLARAVVAAREAVAAFDAMSDLSGGQVAALIAALRPLTTGGQ